MPKFLLVAAREGAEILESEYNDFLVRSGLSRDELDHCIINEVTAELPGLEPYDGIFVGGSPFNVLEKNPTDVQRHVEKLTGGLIDDPKPTFYVCYGNSVVTATKAGVVSDKYAEVAGKSLVRITDKGKADPLLRGVDEEFWALTGHQESVEKLAPGAVLLADGPTCPVQMFRVGDSTWSCQFHPEMTPESLAFRMETYKDKGYFDPEEFDRIVAEVSDLDTSAANSIIRNFVDYCLKQTR